MRVCVGGDGGWLITRTIHKKKHTHRDSPATPKEQERGPTLHHYRVTHGCTCWMTAASRKSLRSARSTIFSSTVPSVMKRNTRT